MFSKPSNYSLLIIVLLLFFNNNGFSAEKQSLSEEIKAIDKKHQSFSAQFHSHTIKPFLRKQSSFQNIDSLEKVVSQTFLTDKILASNMIVQNMAILKDNYDSLAIIKLIKILLEQNELNSANDLFNLIKQEAEQTLFSNVAYLFADYYFQRKNWLETLTQLDDIIDDLSDESYFHALLIQGISLQKLAKHRDSIHAYEKILPTSIYYPAAKVNMAIANIRQGWWTDGHNHIQEILALAERNQKESTLNRLYLTLGFSFLKQEYYRNSRESFRNVGINSIYTNQALLGIALTAANQNDFIGALNATRILKNKGSNDLPVDESNFLMPYFYEQLQQHATASTGYSQAVSYFQKRIANVYKVLNINNSLSEYLIQVEFNATIEIENHLINLSSLYPNYFFRNYLTLKKYKTHLSHMNSSQLTNDFAKLKTDYEETISKMVNNLLNQQIKQLNSYMDQSRYGLARLYDNNLVSK